MGLTVVCVYRPGGGFSYDYVIRLRDGVREHSYIHDRFVCLSTQKLRNVETIQLKHHWPGYWSKLELFRPGLFSGRVAYLDLDTMIVGDISDIIADDSEFGCGTNWKGGGTEINSSFMTWDADKDFSCLYTKFDPVVIPQYEKSWKRWGDQGFIQDNLPVPFTSLYEKYPGRIVSYKETVLKLGKVPREADMVVFHGKPRPAAINWTLPARA